MKACPTVLLPVGEKVAAGRMRGRPGRIADQVTGKSLPTLGFPSLEDAITS